jgi:hypothetical protein
MADILNSPHLHHGLATRADRIGTVNPSG